MGSKKQYSHKISNTVSDGVYSPSILSQKYIALKVIPMRQMIIILFRYTIFFSQIKNILFALLVVIKVLDLGNIAAKNAPEIVVNNNVILYAKEYIPNHSFCW
jgi:hypothetical protein